MSQDAPVVDVREIPLARIDAPAIPSRSEMEEQALDDLAMNIRQVGLINPIAVFAEGDRYRIAAGHRRFEAHKRAGLVAIIARVYVSEAIAIEAIQFAENAYREELPPADEAILFAQLLDKYPNDGTDGLAARLRVKRDYLENRLNLLRGDVEIFGALQRHEIGVGVATELNRIASPHFRRMFLEQAIANGATVAIASGWVRYYRTTLAPATNDGAALETPAVDAGAQPPNYFTCAVCGREADTASMRPVQIHRYCEQAELAPALVMYRERHLHMRRPSTADQAAALIAELVEQFPSLLPQESTPA